MHPFIRIPYNSDAENQGIWSAKEYANVVKTFKGKLSPPEDPKTKEIINLLAKAFSSESRDGLASFVRKHPSKDYAGIFAEFVKAKYSK